ncbi:hypothetical protein BHF71_02370 [Vulcanibacillus modesticaldus]|uniref:Radical SAM protein n=1 Tax=Vulcanibacillus modesticaldus TaxID=337097 RepID=A0A1D2YTL5_9BACI|nr:hypothetical protein [Vulcanibacillus modesticaldus]OEF99050.1 hypothetical protein BHF71_02370 [Vulcanibacillus modesticaldus]
MGQDREYFFVFDERLGIKTPILKKEWDGYTEQEQLDIIKIWEQERAKIPNQIKIMEQMIIEKQNLMFDIDYEEYCEIHKKIIELASIINDLNILFRTEAYLTKK